MSGEISSCGDLDDELFHLVEGLIDGTLSEDEQRCLEVRLGSEPAAAEYCAQRMRFDADLSECLNPTRFELIQSRRFVVEGRGRDRRVIVRQTQEALIGRAGSTTSLPERNKTSDSGKQTLSNSLPLLLVILLGFLGVGFLVYQNPHPPDPVAPPDPPHIVTSLWHRAPKDDADLKYWLENMVWYHHFETREISAATGLTEEEILAALARLNIRQDKAPARNPSTLTTLPYPGGRHPRTDYLEHAINPQRETKVSVFPPWDDGGYLVLDVPEAINIGGTLFYIAHSDTATIWERQNIILPPQEWIRKKHGQLESSRILPNGIKFAVQVQPAPEAVHLTLEIHNGSAGPLKDIGIQNCVLLGRARGFETQQEGDTFTLDGYQACRSRDGERWVITSWESAKRIWEIPECPCIHADPFLPMCHSGETIKLNGWVSFYEGLNIEEEIHRIEATGWKNR
jgi:hypothetical protein